MESSGQAVAEQSISVADIIASPGKWRGSWLRNHNLSRPTHRGVIFKTTVVEQDQNTRIRFRLRLRCRQSS
jgi:hypothetical protein